MVLCIRPPNQTIKQCRRMEKKEAQPQIYIKEPMCHFRISKRDQVTHSTVYEQVQIDCGLLFWEMQGDYYS